MDLKNVASLTFFCPEIVLSATILLIIVLDLIAQSRRWPAALALIGCLCSLIVSFDLYSAQPGLLFHRMIVLDNFSHLFQSVFLGGDDPVYSHVHRQQGDRPGP